MLGVSLPKPPGIKTSSLAKVVVVAAVLPLLKHEVVNVNGSEWPTILVVGLDSPPTTSTLLGGWSLSGEHDGWRRRGRDPSDAGYLRLP